MINLFDVKTGNHIGEITEAQLRFLQEELVEEGAEDRDYYINRATLDMFEKDRADPVMLAILRDAMGERDSIDIRWEQA